MVLTEKQYCHFGFIQQRHCAKRPLEEIFRCLVVNNQVEHLGINTVVVYHFQKCSESTYPN